ncbi:MAG: hypothetical protein JWO80_2325 [Bryobacterales bacterium]|nr:hypothetical protein [Bryobacterales bacterium]
MKSHVWALAAFATASLWAQEFRGTFSGTVRDAQGSAMPKVKITATETQTGNKSETFSSTTGEYTIPFLAPGEYQIEAEAPGFKTYTRKGLTLSIGEHPEVDIKLEVGQSNQSVVVTAEVSMIESSNASLGQVISTEEVENMPTNGRTPLMLSRLAMGVIATNEPGPVRPFDNGAVSSFSISGGPSGQNELLLNGVPDAGFSKQLAYSPPQDAVQEVSVRSFESDAAYGHTGGGVANHITRGGTNAFHGSLYEFNQVSKLAANLFFSNKLAVPRPVTNYNQYGVTVGGPVIVPKLYNGKNRVFWFFAFERLKDSDPANSVVEGGSTITTVPTAAERKGDFSALLNVNASYTIYDPASGVLASNGRVARTAFPNNVIPTSRLNPIALNYLQYYPLPNTAGLSNGENNYGITIADSDKYDNELGRIDVNFSERSKLSYDFRHSDRLQNKNNYFSNAAFGDYLSRINWGTALDEVYTLSPTLILDVRANWTRFHESNAAPGDGVNPASLGFPGYLAQYSQFVGLPYMQFAGGCGANATAYQCIGMTGDNDTPYDVFQLFGSIVKIRGNHSLKTGADIREYRESTFAHGNSDGTFSFNSNWTNNPSASTSSSPFGQDFAAFLLGLPSSGSFDLNTHSTTKSDYYAFYLQDDWRARSNLTINMGLRWEHETPTVERYNRAVNGFDPKQANPIAAAAAAAFAKNPVAQLQQFTVPGGLTFAGSGSPNIYRSASSLWSPRIGFAWTPKALGGKTVLRSGFGIFVAPNGINGGQTLNQEGFSQTTQLTATNDNYLTPANTLSDPFPNGILQPSGSAKGAGTFLGQGVTIFNPNVKNAYSVRWNFGIQRQLPGQIVLEIAYVGNHSVHLPITRQTDSIPRQYLSASPVRDNNAVNFLNTTVANPLQGLVPNSSASNGATVALRQLLIPFPQYPVPGTPASNSNGVVMQYSNGGESIYNSLQVRVQKRFTHGLTFINNFLWSNATDRINYLTDSDPAPEKRIAADSRPLREVMSASYDLPFGHGRRYDLQGRAFSPVGFLNFVAGGWSANGNVTFQSGPPLSFGNLIYYGGPLQLNPHDPDGPVFDTTRFNTISNQQLADNIRTFDTQFGNLRRDPTKNLDLSMLKRFNFGERKYLQIRFESFNLTNRVTFAAPNLSATSTSFGLITSQANTPRRIQLGARLAW